MSPPIIVYELFVDLRIVLEDVLDTLAHLRPRIAAG